MAEHISDYSPSSKSRSSLVVMDYELELPEWSKESLRSTATQMRLPRPRSLAWAILLQAVPPLNEDIRKSIQIHRNFYEDLKSKLSMDPRAVIGDDPLSQNDESAWKQHFCDNELQALILQDVVRTFPDEPYFRDSKIQDLMVRVLFFWARSHAVGYRQGMHEILAPLLLELYMDRKLAPSNLGELLRYYLEETYLEHDSFMLFSAVMKGLEKFYSTGDAVPSSCGRLPPSRQIHSPNEVVRYLERVRDEHLVIQDTELAAHLNQCNITMELFGIRWVRLLFGREFKRSELPQLWSFVFADGPLLPYLHNMIVALLISLRSILLDPEPGVVLSALMRPSGVPVSHVCALALHLRLPTIYPRPPPYQIQQLTNHVSGSETASTWTLEQVGSETGWESGSEGGVGGMGGMGGGSVSEGVAVGADVARELAALAVLRAHLPAAAAALASALPHPPPGAASPLRQILQLAALLQCRNHALVDVETALEAAEGQNTDKVGVGRRQLVPVSVIGGRSSLTKQKQNNKQPPKVKEVQLKVFHQSECKNASDLPCLDPLRLRTE